MELSHLRVAFVVGMLLAVLGSSQAAADLVRIPGTSTSLEPPAGFSPTANFPGFAHPELGASIMVTEVPGPLAEALTGLTKEALAARGVTLLSSQPEKVGGREALLLHCAQTAAGTEYLKWMLVMGDENDAVLIVGIFPKSAREQVGEAIRRSVLTASWIKRSAIDPFEGLQFRVTPTPKLKVALGMDNTLMLTESGSKGPLPPGEPRYIVGSSIGLRKGDLRSFSETRARQTEQIRDLQNISGQEISVGGFAAYELVADAKDLESETAVRLYQVIIEKGSGYFIVQAFVGAERAAELLPEFRRVTESFRRTDGGR